MGPVGGGPHALAQEVLGRLEPARLGVDRFLALLAAHGRGAGPCLIAGVGTGAGGSAPHPSPSTAAASDRNRSVRMARF